MKVLFTIWAKVGTEEHKGTQRNTETVVFAPDKIR